MRIFHIRLKRASLRKRKALAQGGFLSLEKVCMYACVSNALCVDTSFRCFVFLSRYS